MKTYLLTWNPSDYKWNTLEKNITAIETSGGLIASWATGNRRKVNIGDRFLLMRLGKKARGIVACGTVESQVFQDLHWAEVEKAKGIKKNFVKSNFLVLSEEPFISEQELNDKYPSFKWNPQGGGINIRPEIADGIFEELMNTRSPENRPDKEEALEIEISDEEFFEEGELIKRTTDSYDRDVNARLAAIKLHGLNCSVCGFNFENVYGPLGDGFIEIHHLRPLSSVRGKHLVNPKHDLRPVCRNCHFMLHRKRECLSIEELRELMPSTQS